MAQPRGQRRVAQVQPIRTGDATADRATGEVAAKVNALARNGLAQSVPVQADLEWGLNRVAHGLNVPVRDFVVVAASDARAVITSRQPENPVPERQVWVHLEGPPSATATLILLPQG